MSATGDALLRIAQANPDIVIHDETPTIRRDTWTQDANHGAQGRLETMQGNNCDSTHVNAPESPLERQFSDLWQMLGGPELEREERFNDDRKWRADFLHAPSKTLIEVEGLIWQPEKYGRHQRPVGYSDDCRKYNMAVMQGYKIIRLTTLTLEPDYIESIIQWMEDEA